MDALKTKGANVPKAGPKRRRFNEEEALRRAVADNSVRPHQGKRKSGKVRRYSYKDPVHRPEPARPHIMREPSPRPEADLVFDNGISAAHAVQMACQHKRTEPVAVRFKAMESEEWGACADCGKIIQVLPSHIGTLRLEWARYILDGWSTEDWDELFVKDKTLWQYIIAEAREES